MSDTHSCSSCFDALDKKDAEIARLTAERDEARQELSHPTFQCSECGSTGPFRDIVYPNTPNGPEEYDMECEDCGSLHVDESPRCAFSSMKNKMDTKLEEALANLDCARGAAHDFERGFNASRAEIARLTAERDAARKERDALRARVAELEAALAPCEAPLHNVPTDCPDYYYIMVEFTMGQLRAARALLAKHKEKQYGKDGGA